MQTDKSDLELLFDHLFHEDTEYIKALLPKARADLQAKCRDLTMDERRKLNYIPSMLGYCHQGRWLQARNQLEPAEQEYLRYFVRHGGIGDKQSFYQLHSPRKSVKDNSVSEPSVKSLQASENEGRNGKASKINGSRRGSSQQGDRTKQTADDVKNVTFAPSPTKQDTKVQTPTSTSLSTQFENLYKSEWVAALEEFESLRIYEKSSITCLLNIVLGAYKMCRLEAENQMSKMEDAMRTIILEGTHDKGQTMTGDCHLLLSYRRELAYICLPRLQETFRRRFLPEMIRSVGIYQTVRTYGPIFTFADKCVSVCWSMVVQDPPLYIRDDRKLHERVDHACYNIYKKSGKLVDYYVWPPLFAYEDGPMIAKGFVEGR